MATTYTIQELADLLHGVKSTATVKLYAQKGRIAATKEGRTWHIDANDKTVKSWIDEADAQHIKSEESEALHIQTSKAFIEAERKRIEAEERAEDLSNTIANYRQQIDNLREQFDKSENARILAEKEAATWRARYETLKEAMERFMQPQPAAQAQTHTAQKTQKNELAERNNRFRSGWAEFHRENPKASMHDFYMTLENPGVSYTRIREILREQD